MEAVTADATQLAPQLPELGLRDWAAAAAEQALRGHVTAAFCALEERVGLAMAALARLGGGGSGGGGLSWPRGWAPRCLPLGVLRRASCLSAQACCHAGALKQTHGPAPRHSISLEQAPTTRRRPWRRRSPARPRRCSAAPWRCCRCGRSARAAAARTQRGDCFSPDVLPSTRAGAEDRWAPCSPLTTQPQLRCSQRSQATDRPCRRRPARSLLCTPRACAPTSRSTRRSWRPCCRSWATSWAARRRRC